MGHQDITSLHKIYRYILHLNKENGWNFSFKVDSGSFETRIDISEDGKCFRGNNQLPLIGYSMYCPDLLDFSRKLIVEYEESSDKQTGYFHAKKSHKGHSDYCNTRDTERDAFYNIAGFKLLKIWDHELKDDTWMLKLDSFLKANLNNKPL